ncbi:hypothetical protein LMTR13_03345 [Bradyrhizobium icense]|uniref:Uncharacterized protein n=1 Tax=Bradyrhizobium icense TaxID=1274631 RepID=A0A1B1U9C1_9BRAD|nr:hypothetical protein LMTR13_03345 [Bradyrhizobium icense]
MFVLCLYLGLRRGPIVANLPIAKTLKTDQSRKIAEAIFRGVPFIIAIVVFVVLVEIIPSVISYAFDPSSAKVEIHKIAHVNSAAMPGAFYIRMGIHTDDNQDLSYWYPDQILQTGGTYSFTLLPNSDFVLKAQLIE